ncbi:hypothetical protein GQR58_000721 [Nymphon striatum]|nr:hypothetical protein GQR58_000721 [Nymphon striatum]
MPTGAFSQQNPQHATAIQPLWGFRLKSILGQVLSQFLCGKYGLPNHYISSILNGAGARRERDTDFSATPLANAAGICPSLDIPQYAVGRGLPQLTTYFKFGSLLTVTPPCSR